MKQNLKAQFIHAAYPDLDERVVDQLVLNDEVVKTAEKLASRNASTRKILFFWYGKKIRKLDKENFLKEYQSQINPCYKAFVNLTMGKKTFLDILAEDEKYDEFSYVASMISLADIQPKNLKTIFNVQKLGQKIKKNILMTPELYYRIRHKQDDLSPEEVTDHIKHTKKCLDTALAHFSKMFGAIDVLKAVFTSNGKEKENLYQMDETPQETDFLKEENLQQVFAVLLENDMTQTAIQLIDSVYDQNKNFQDVISLISSRKTNQLFSKVSYFNSINDPKMKENTVFLVKNHLENKLPHNLFMETVEKLPLYHEWYKDFER